MRLFRLNRIKDVVGISGTGYVAEGVQFADGQCALWWENHGAICIFHTMADLLTVHCSNGNTEVEFL